MPNFYEIPLKAQTQKLTVSLSGTDYQLTIIYRKGLAQSWFVDIADAAGIPIVQGIPLVTGVDLLAQYPHLGFQGRLWVQTTDDPDAVPTYDNLGIGSKLYWVTG